MAVARPRIVVGAVLAAAVAAAGLTLGTQSGGGPEQSPGTYATAKRGVVDTTVGGVGHVTTLNGAALLSIPSFSSSSGAEVGSGSTVGSSISAAAGGASSSASSSSGAGGSTAVPADAVFPTVSGHVSRLLVREGDRVRRGQPIATVSDDGATEGTVLARDELATARLELAQRKVHDPLLGPPPTLAELRAGQQAIVTAKTALRDLRGPPPPADAAAARSELARAVAELHSSQASPTAIRVAELAVTTAQQNLQTLTGAPDPAELAAAQLEVANAVAAQGSLPAEATPAESAAAQLAVTAAQQKLNQLIHPPLASLSAAQGELAKAELDLQALLATRHGPGFSALRAAVAAARSRLAHLRPTEATIATAQSEVRKARADLAILRQRGAPASAIDQALARLKVVMGRKRLALAKHLAGQLTVRARASGTVTSVLSAVGAPVDPTTPLIRVQDLGNLVVALDLSEFDVARVRVGELTRVGVDALGGRQVKGRVISVSPTGAEAGGVVNFSVTIALRAAGGEGDIRPGMSVSARIVTRIRRDTLRIPSAAVSGGERPTVTVREPSGRLTRRPVELGLEGPKMVEVRSGLRLGDRVLIPAGGGE